MDAGAVLQLDFNRAEVAVVGNVGANPEGRAARDGGVREQERGDAGGLRRGTDGLAAGVAVDFRRAQQLGRGGEEGVELGRGGGGRGEAEEVQAGGGPFIAGGHGFAREAPDKVGGVGVTHEVGAIGGEADEGVGDERRAVPDEPLAVENGGLLGRGGELRGGDGRLPEPDFSDGVARGDEVVEENVRGVHMEEDGVPAGLERDGLGEPLGAGGGGERQGEQQQGEHGPAPVGLRCARP